MRDELFEQGLRARKEVLGADYVERQFRNADEFSRPLQELATKGAWGLIWTRPGLSRRIRSMVTIAFVTARGKADELELHVRGAIRNGVTKKEIQEILLQSSAYCGFPEALGAFRVARKVFEEIEGRKASSGRKASGKRK